MANIKAQKNAPLVTLPRDGKFGKRTPFLPESMARGVIQGFTEEYKNVSTAEEKIAVLAAAQAKADEWVAKGMVALEPGYAFKAIWSQRYSKIGFLADDGTRGGKGALTDSLT